MPKWHHLFWLLVTSGVTHYVYLAMNKWFASRAVLVLLFASTGLVSGCNSRADEAGKAVARYQAAEAAGDLRGAHRALLDLVRADDTVPEYWIELGRTELELEDFGASYDSFLRAHELDRANPSILGALTQLALRSGNLDRAEEHARELELVSPQDPAVRLTYGYVALRRDNLPAAKEQVGLLLASAPYDPSAKILESRILLQSDRPDDAVALLREQLRVQPDDELTRRALLSMYELRERWPDAAMTARQILQSKPNDQRIRARAIESSLKAGDVAVARDLTMTGLPMAQAPDIDALLQPWISNARSDEIRDQLFAFARKSDGDRRLALARFLDRAGNADRVLVLLDGVATLPVRPATLSANALYGSALVQIGRSAEGMDRIDRVLSQDPANTDALRGRISQLLRSKSYDRAIDDARRLVAADRGSAQARLDLVRTCLAANRPDEANRALWEAFHDIPANRPIYDLLRSVVARDSGASAVSRLKEEFDDQRQDELTRSFA